VRKGVAKQEDSRILAWFRRSSCGKRVYLGSCRYLGVLFQRGDLSVRRFVSRQNSCKYSEIPYEKENLPMRGGFT
jgi:hypothetical protein